MVRRSMGYSKKPLVIAGHGVRLANAQGLLFEFLERYNLPVVTTFNGFDLIPSDYHLFRGRIGTIGTTEGNEYLKKADLILCLGTRNNIRQISYTWNKFAMSSQKIIVDIDRAELNKKTIKGDIMVHKDIKDFLKEMLND